MDPNTTLAPETPAARKRTWRLPPWVGPGCVIVIVIALLAVVIVKISDTVADYDLMNTRQKAEVTAAVHAAGWELAGPLDTGQEPSHNGGVLSLTGQVQFGACVLKVSAYGDATSDVLLYIVVHSHGWEVVFHLKDVKYDNLRRDRDRYGLSDCFPPSG